MSDRYRDDYNRQSDDYSDGFDIYSLRSGQRRRTSEKSKEYDYSEEIFSSSSRSERKEAKRRKRRNRRLKRFVSLLLILLLALSVWMVVFTGKVLNIIDYEQLGSYAQPYESSDGNGLVSSNGIFNIMLFGVDDNTGESGRSDTMILLSVDKLHSKIKLTSFQRDTFVYVPDKDGDYHTKLTNAYSYGGVGLAMRTIEANYGVKIDRYVTVNFETFKTIVDILGGVEVELTDREILYINCQIAQNNQTEYLDANEGKVLLNGQQALWHARNRGGDVINGVEFYEGTDWDRTERQRSLFESVMKHMKSASVFELLQIAEGVAPYITTDLTKTELAGLFLNSPRFLRFQVEQCSMPSDGTWGYEQNFAGDVIYIYDWQTAREDIKDFIYEE